MPYLCRTNQNTYYNMTIKKKHFILIALISCGLVLSIWAFVNYQTKRKAKEQIDNALAQRFDEAMDAAFPLLENYAIAMKDRADSIENMAIKAKEDSINKYRDAFTKLWVQYTRSEKSINNYVLIEEFSYFRMSPIFEMLINSGDKKKNESEAIKELTMAGMALNDPYRMEYDSLINTSKEVKQFISDYQEAISPYHSDKDNIRAWRELMLR